MVLDNPFEDFKKNVKDNGFKRLFTESAGDSFPQTPDETDVIVEAEKKAYAKGFADGQTSAVQEEQIKLTAVLNDFQSVFSNFEKIKKENCKQAEVNAVKIAMAIAKKIVLGEVSINEDMVIKTVNQVMDKIMGDEQVKIKIHPDDLQIIKMHETDNAELILNRKSVFFEEDPEITRGGCVVETDSGNIDARLESQLLIIEEAFLDKIGQQNG